MIGTGFILLLAGFLFVVAGSFVSLYLTFIGLGLIIVSSYIFWRQASRSLWKCSKCGSEKRLTNKELLLRTTTGYKEKDLYCDNCKQNTIHTMK